jgi:hypothetical protein
MYTPIHFSWWKRHCLLSLNGELINVLNHHNLFARITIKSFVYFVILCVVSAPILHNNVKVNATSL